MHGVDIPLNFSKLKQEVIIAQQMLLQAPFLFIQKYIHHTFYSLVASLLFMLIILS